MRERSEAMFTQEMDYALHLGIERVMVDMPDLDKCPSIDNFARILNRYLEDITISNRVLLRVRIPGNEQEAESMFERYIQLKTLCNFSTKLSMVLSFSAELPSDEYMSRFFGESVTAIELGSGVFIKNAK